MMKPQIWAGGYTSGIYKINKETLSVEYFSPYLLSHVNMRPDKYIRDIVKKIQEDISGREAIII